MPGARTSCAKPTANGATGTNPGRQHRHYLICRRCGHSEPVDTTLVEDWARRLARDTGYADLHHTLELAGVCGPCHAAADN